MVRDGSAERQLLEIVHEDAEHLSSCEYLWLCQLAMSVRELRELRMLDRHTRAARRELVRCVQKLVRAHATRRASRGAPLPGGGGRSSD